MIRRAIEGSVCIIVTIGSLVWFLIARGVR